MDRTPDDTVRNDGHLLRESEERLRMFISGVKDYAIFMLDTAGRIVSWNAGAERIKGYRADEIIGQHFSIFYPAEDKQVDKPGKELVIAVREGQYAEEGWRLRKDGTRFWASVLITPVFDQAGVLHGFGKVTRDMTERMRHEEALRQSEERFRLLVEGVRDYAIFMLDSAGRIVSWNSGAEVISGYPAEEVIGRSVGLLYQEKDLRDGVPAQNLRVAAERGRFEEEGWRLRKDGTRFWANVVITALYDERRQLQGYAKVTRDMTEQRRAEAQRELLAREREQRTQLEAHMRMRDEFLGVTAHELRTPVTSLLGYAQLTRRRLDQHAPDDARLTRALDVVIRQAHRLDRLTTMLLDLTRLDHGRLVLQLAAVDLTALVARIGDEIQLLTSHHTLAIRHPDAPLIVQGDELRLEQVLYNLVLNAIKYSPAGGLVEIELRREGSSAVIAVTDHGLGIPADDIPHVFDRFFRAQNASVQHISGMGIGLFLVYELVSLHGGTVGVRSTLGEGSTFMVTLPLET